MSSHCISGDNILVVPGSINAVLDAFIIALVSVPGERGERILMCFKPLPLLWRLRTTYRQKIVLVSITKGSHEIITYIRRRESLLVEGCECMRALGAIVLMHRS